jgi:hypothetical protein
MGSLGAYSSWVALFLLLIMTRARSNPVVKNVEDEVCRSSDVKVTQRLLTPPNFFPPIWSVEVANQCGCSVLDVVLNCHGMKQGSVHPAKLLVFGDQCLVALGGLISSFGPRQFEYIQNHVNLSLNSTRILPSCSAT